MNRRIEKSMQVIGNLPTYLEASYLRSHDNSIPKEYALNRCLKHIESIQSARAEGKEAKAKAEALEQAWKIYLKLQNFQPRSGERLDYNPQREVSLDNLGSLDDLQEEGTVEISSPDLYSGGLGYRNVNWKAEYLMAQPKGKHADSYWRPDLPRNKPGTKEHREMLSLEESGYWACKQDKSEKWYEKMGLKLVESSNR
tara:strand:+ start:325 stop:918 length:594 start_codon:yes stop_codon:yes gene_type:complete